MADRTEKYGSTDKTDRLKVVWGGFAKRIRDFGLAGFQPREPDWKKVEAAMKSGGKADFLLRFSSGRFVASVQCGGTALTVAALDTTKEKDRDKQRAMLAAINARAADLYTSADLKAWDQAHPDPIVLARVKGEVENLKKQVEAMSKKVKRAKNYDTMPDNERDYLFLRFMEKKNYGQYVSMLNEHRYGRDPAGIVAEYFADDSKRRVVIDEKVRKKLVADVAAKKAPDLKAAVKETKGKVDKLLPAYYDEIDQGAVKNLPAVKKMLADKVKELKDLVGR